MKIQIKSSNELDTSIKSIRIIKVLYSYREKYREGRLKRIRQDSEIELESINLKSVPDHQKMEWITFCIRGQQVN